MLSSTVNDSSFRTKKVLSQKVVRRVTLVDPSIKNFM